MKVYQDLKIKLNIEKKEIFIKYLRDMVEHSSEWKNRIDVEEGFKKRSVSIGFNVYCFESGKYEVEGETISGILWMRDEGISLEVFNIIPTIGNHLSHDQYNFILRRFKDEFIDHLVHDYQAEVYLSKDYFDMEDHIGKWALEKLNFFSETSNHSTGRSHPLDFKKWVEFIFAVHQEKKHLSADDLYHWLLEHGWWDEMANELSLDFEYSIELLEEYDKVRR